MALKILIWIGITILLLFMVNSESYRVTQSKRLDRLENESGLKTESTIKGNNFTQFEKLKEEYLNHRHRGIYGKIR